MSRSQVYVSGALTGAEDPVGARALYEGIAEAAGVAGFRAYVPHRATDPINHPDVSPSAVFTRDLDAIMSSDTVVAWLGTPSLGVGAEIALAVRAGKRVIGVRPEGQQVSRFILGLLHSANSPIIEIQDATDLNGVVHALLQNGEEV